MMLLHLVPMEVVQKKELKTIKTKTVHIDKHCVHRGVYE